jgi:hypothetical protein
MAACRKVLNLPKCEGRPSLPSEEEQNMLWEYINPEDIKQTDQLANRLLSASRETGIKINVIWATLNQWIKETAIIE